MLVLMMAAAMATTPAAGDAPALKVADPLAPARAGKLLCQTPKAEGKSCAALSRFEFQPDGKIVRVTDARLTRTPWVYVRLHNPVEIRDGSVCAPFDGFDKAEVFQEGKAADEETTARTRKGLVEIFGWAADKVGCTTYEPREQGLVAQLKIGDDPRHPEPVQWVDPAEGWAAR